MGKNYLCFANKFKSETHAARIKFLKQNDDRVSISVPPYNNNKIIKTVVPIGAHWQKYKSTHYSMDHITFTDLN